MNETSYPSMSGTPSGNLAEAIIAGCPDPTKTAFFHPDGAQSYAELFQSAANISESVGQSGAVRDDRVVLMLYDTPAFAECFLGLLMGGFIPVAVNPRLKPAALAHIIEDCGARLLIAEPDCVADASAACELLPDRRIQLAVQDAWPAPNVTFGSPEPWLRVSTMRDGRSLIRCAPRAQSDVALLQYTSGTTGRPKGVQHLASGVQHCAAAFAQGALKLSSDDLLFSTAKMFFGYGQGNSLLFPLLLGATSILDPRWPSPDTVVETLERHRPTALFSVPTLYAALLSKPDALLRSGALSRLRILFSAGSPLPEKIYRSWRDVLGKEILDGIGATEVGHVFLGNRPSEARAGATGKPLDGYEVRLEARRDAVHRDAGVLWVRGRSVSPGYWGNPTATLEKFHDGWYETGDVFVRDADGYYHYRGRADDMFKVNSRWVTPVEVETRVLQAAPQIREAALVPSYDAYGLIRPLLALTLRDPDADRDVVAQTILASLKANVDSYKLPTRIVFLEAMPTNENGKLLRHEISRLWGDLEQQHHQSSNQFDLSQ